ncbi:GH36-type glycosyl hydrolase domain-containing protein [Pengzhenrongella phosphoraccumulans]|uniref:GH36-type glycosyl hydrolase domain-containing protein n=1 Tax=Pengzhenrongella phosphoraccumulans TaxID=3114394 RepID=UPI00388E332A
MTFSPDGGRRPSPDRTFRSASGVWAQFTESAALHRLDVGDHSVLMYPSDDIEAGPANLFLRLHRPDGVVVTPLLGPASPGAVDWTEAGPEIRGTWRDLSFRVCFVLAATDTAWFWHVEVTNSGALPVTVDVVHTQDVALAPYTELRVNEYYVAQYLDLNPIQTGPAGTAIAVRQNMPAARAPWLVLGCLREAVAWGTDALQLVGRAGLRDVVPPGLTADRLPSSRLQHEHTLAMLQDRPEQLAPGAILTTGFYGIYRPDHPEATSPADAAVAAIAASLPEAAAPTGAAPPAYEVVGSLFSSAPILAARPLDEPALTALAGPGVHHAEREGDDMLAFFTDDGTHVVTAAKERAVLRPHGHIMRTGDGLVPDESSLTTTAWMAGVFHSQLTQGHVSRDSLLSTRRGYLGLRRAFGLRVFVESAGAWSLLDVPSAWALTPDSCRWWYAHDGGLLEVRSFVAADTHEVRLIVRVVTGEPVRALVCAHIAFGGDDGADAVLSNFEVDPLGVTVRAPEGSAITARSPGASFRFAWADGAIETVARDAALFADGLTREAPWLTLTTAPTRQLDVTITADVVPAARLAAQGAAEPTWPDFWAGITDAVGLQAPVGTPWSAEVDELNAVLPWFSHDALIHYLAPRGLEQYTGGAWGTRDVCQGPVGLLLALGQTAPLRDLVLRVLRGQNARGDWPQWFEFLDLDSAQGQSAAHGDVVYWPLLAVGEYLATTGDRSLLDESVAYVGDDGPTAPAPVLDHLRRALAHISASTVPDSPLPAYGNGDWNDSLQPADPALAARLCSTWTVTQQVFSLRTLAAALRGLDPSGVHGADDLADDAVVQADRSAAALDELLVGDGLLCGYGLFHDDGTVEHLVHPSDERTGLRYSVLPMINAITGDLLSPESARTHLDAIEQHLLGPDGARLFDAPARYQGGPMEVFKRAEASTFFGREIGIMYTHAHLRYAEALARHGDAEKLLPALMLANPIGIGGRVATAAARQSTCYYSSSDAAFTDRYDAAAHYDRIGTGEVALEGGWRVYSSGPGLFLRLVVETLLGVRRRGETLELDPVLPSSLDGLTATVPLDGRALHLTYTVGPSGCGPVSVLLDGVPLTTTALANPYRRHGVSVDLAAVRAALDAGGGALQVTTA